VAQQIAEPQRIYAEPANLDVARFMGYRNLVALDVRSGGGASVQLAGSGLALTARAMQPLTGGKAMLAIRPEEFEVGTITRTVVATETQLGVHRADFDAPEILATRERDPGTHGRALCFVAGLNCLLLHAHRVAFQNQPRNLSFGTGLVTCRHESERTRATETSLTESLTPMVSVHGWTIGAGTGEIPRTNADLYSSTRARVSGKLGGRFVAHRTRRRDSNWSRQPRFGPDIGLHAIV